MTRRRFVFTNPVERHSITVPRSAVFLGILWVCVVMREPFVEEMKTRVLLADGAMGTQLNEAGLAAGQPGDDRDLSHPARLGRIHSEHVARSHHARGMEHKPSCN